MPERKRDRCADHPEPLHRRRTDRDDAVARYAVQRVNHAARCERMPVDVEPEVRLG